MSGCVGDYYIGRSILVTGASGFVGKVVIEKLLYGCPGIENIFILIRPKHEISTQIRLDKIFEIPLFDRIRQEKPDVFKKVVPFPADLSMDNLGLDEENIKKLKKVSVVLHAAACVRFDVSFKTIMRINLEGTYKLLELCKQLEKLEIFIYVSTAYCHSEIEVLDEKIYKPKVSPLDIIEMCSWMDDATIQKITPDLLEQQPNSYTYSKRMAEALVNSYFPELPVVVARPSIISPTFKDPMPGWIDNLYGPVSFSLAGGKGILFSVIGEPESYVQIIPVDICGNILCAIPWYMKTNTNLKTPLESYSTTPVFNLTNAKELQYTWKDVCRTINKRFEKYPFEMMLWYPFIIIQRNVLVHYINVILFQWIPSCLIDLILVLVGQKPFLINVQKKLHMAISVIKYFSLRNWNFKIDNTLNMKKLMDENGRSLFSIEYENFNIEDYLDNWILGVRTYLMKEDPASIPRKRIHYKLLYILHRLSIGFFYILFGWIIFNYILIPVKSSYYSLN